MDTKLISEVAGYIAVSCGFVMVSIQAVRIQRFGSEGVSPFAWSLFFWANTFFAVWGWAIHYLPIAIGASVISPIMLFIVSKTALRAAVKGFALATAICAVVIAAPVVIWNWDAGIVGATAIQLALTIPAIIALYQSNTAAGSAATAWFVNSAATFILAFSGALQERWVFMITQLCVCASNVAIGLLTVQRHRKLHRIEATAGV